MSRFTLSFALLLSLCPAILLGQPKEPLAKARVIIRHASDRAAAQKLGPLQDDYGTFVVVRLPEQALEHARARGLDIELLDENIGIGAFKFDPERGTPSVPQNLADDEHGPDARYYIVQFRGPVRDEWLETARQSGIETLQYVRDNAWIVRATPPQIASAAHRAEIRWSGLYHPAYKLGADLEWMLGSPIQRTQPDHQLYRVAVFRGHDLGALTSSIARLGGTIDREEDVPALYFRTLLVDIDTDRLGDLAKMREVARIETWYPPKSEDERSDQILAGNYSGTTVTSAGYTTFLNSRGVDGTGITVGIVDDGVDATEMHLAGRVTDNATLRHGASAGAYGHGHHVAGIVAGSCTHTDSGGFLWAEGMAPGAHVINIPLLKSGYGASDAQSQSDVADTAAANGSAGTISSNSWGAGYGASYGSMEATYDALVQDASSAQAGQQPLAIVFSAGNSGPSASSITAPKAAKNLLVVGASNNYRPTANGSTSCGSVDAANIDKIACFSSRGPTTDGRIRPDVVAPGTWIASALSGTDTLWGDIDANHRYCTGTSQACPHASGATALIQQWWKSTHGGQLPAPALSKAMLINGAIDPGYDAVGAVPNNTEGWGRINLARVINSGVTTIYDNQQDVLSSAGQQYSISGNVADASQPFRVTLVWTDPPAAAGANPALVNNLDLEVTINGNTYKGNFFSNGTSTTGGTADAKNNVEAVYFPAGLVSGAFTVTVRLTSVGGDGAPGNQDTTDQHFALVVFNGSTCATTPVASAVANGNNRIDVSWQPVPNASGYRVLRATTQGGPYVQIATPNASPFSDTTVSGYVTYFYVVSATGACESPNSAETFATANGPLDPPTGTAATITNSTNVALSWNAAPVASYYKVYRTADNATWYLVATPVGTSWTDTSTSAGVAYLYNIHTQYFAVESPDGASTRALALPRTYIDPSLLAGTKIKGTHFTELRSAVNAVRMLANPAGGAFSFTDASLSNVQVKRAHLVELRSELDTARALLGLPALTYTNPTVTQHATIVRRAHVLELRQGAGTVWTPANAQLLLNPGFESGNVNWTMTPGVLWNYASDAHAGSFCALLDGYASPHTDSVEQQVAIPADALSATLTFWLRIASDQPGTLPVDTLSIQILDSTGTLLRTIGTFTNLDESAYAQHSFDVLAYRGQTIRVKFYGVQTTSTATNFYVDDVGLTIEE